MPTVARTALAKRAAFSLVELLAVISLILVMTGLSVATLTGQNSGKVSSSVRQLTGLLEQGRQLAIAQKTYVWVACHEPANGSESLLVAVLAANDGANSIPWTSSSTEPSANVSLISKVFALPHVRLQDAGVFTADDVAPLQGEPVAIGPIHSLATNKPAFAIQYQGESINFERVIQFTPSGQVRTGTSPIDFVEIGLQAVQGDLPDAKNVALVRINGLTGLSRVFRK